MPQDLTALGEKSSSAKLRTLKCIAPPHSAAELRELTKALLPKRELKKRVCYFEILSNPARLQIAHLLQKKKRLCVCDLATTIGLSSSALSQHLRKMRDCGLVDFQRRGQTIFYFLIDTHFCKLLK